MALAFFQSTVTNTIVSLDSVQTVARNRKATATTNPVESGQLITDNYIVEPLTASYTGILSNTNKLSDSVGVKNRLANQSSLTVEGLIKEMDQQIKSKALFTFYLSNAKGETEIIPNCVITSFDIDKGLGMSDSFNVSVSIQEIIITERATQTTIKLPKADFSNQAGGNGGDSSIDGSDNKGDKSTKDMSRTGFRLAADEGLSQVDYYKEKLLGGGL